MNKIREYFSTLEITRGLGIALLGSLFIYLHYWGYHSLFLNTVFALSSLFLLLLSPIKVWFWYGFFIGIFWFWWVALSLQHYGYSWGLPLGILFLALLYGFLFWAIAKIASIPTQWYPQQKISTFYTLLFKALGLILLSYVHPFGFDWLKPELVFVESYIGIDKWKFMLVLAAIVLTLWKKNFLFLLLILFTYTPQSTVIQHNTNEIVLVSTHVQVSDKWDQSKHIEQFENNFRAIDKAILEKKKIVVLPESVFPVFLNKNAMLLEMLQERAKKIVIITGGLYWHNNRPYNSTYIFNQESIKVANKVLLVPFGESNPLPDFLSDWINKVFYDGAIDYIGGAKITDYTAAGKQYRNAICFEATSEALYKEDTNGKTPENMIILSNNGWFTPSIEPTLQTLLLMYYNKKYGTTMYHAVNMSDSYIIQNHISIED